MADRCCRSRRSSTAEFVSSYRQDPCYVAPDSSHLKPTRSSEDDDDDDITSRNPFSALVTPFWTRQRRRRQHAYSPLLAGSLNLQTLLFVSLCAILWCGSCASATVMFDETSLIGGYNEIIWDQSPAPPPHVRLIKRAEAATTASSKTTGTASSATMQASSAPLPSPFDSSLGNNFTQSSCPTFFQSFLGDSTFHSCIPFSLLLQTSTSFFNVEQSPVLLAQTLEATCNVNFTVCSTLMASLARQIQLPSNCGADLQAENPTVLQAYNGLASYQTMYHAGCLQDSETGAYCFSDAVTNSSAPTSSYIYFLPLGVSLPTTTRPTCSTCLKQTMVLFADAAGNKSQPISGIYGNAASIVDQYCGEGFASAAAASSSGSSSSSSTSAAMSLKWQGEGGSWLLVLVAVVSLLLC